MIVMISNQTGFEAGLLCGLYPGRVGHLYSYDAQRGPYPADVVPAALDNTRYICWDKGIEWEEPRYRHMLNWALMSGLDPLWSLCPDLPTDRDGTLREWEKWSPELRKLGFKRLAFAVQNGMTFADVPDDDCVLFLGGDDTFKDAAIGPWCARFPGRVHVGRVNGMPRLPPGWRDLRRRHRVVPQGAGRLLAIQRPAEIPPRDQRRADERGRLGDSMFATIAKRFTFDAAHYLPTVAEGHKCRRMHGHTYTVELVAYGRVQRDGFVEDYADIAEKWQPIHEQLDHRCLNDIEGLEIPSTEILAHWIWDRLGGERWPRLKTIRIYESSTTWCEVTRADRER